MTRQRRLYRPTTASTQGPELLHVNLDPPPWMDDAACATTPNPEAWFPGNLPVGRRKSYTQLVAANNQLSATRAICGTCPVAVQCLTHALENDERYGIWGGLTPGERQRLVDGEGS